jgi:hypothetical protein
MSITALHILAKNTDATAALKGYQYQILKTLETWLSNRVHKVDQTIYCDYEEDIYQQDNLTHTAKFRQLKLYSTNFSFSSEEVKKAIAHFFMLYVKGEYSFDDVEFTFETNAYIKNNRTGNNANLLKEWFENQSDPSDELLEQTSGIVKSILENYVNEQSKEPSAENKMLVQRAADLFKSLTTEDFIIFTKKIKWEFQNLEPDASLEFLVSNIKLLIEALPQPDANENSSILIGRLHYEILTRATKKEVEEKELTNTLLDSILLQMGDQEEKWYDTQYQIWVKNSKLERFNTGEFLEIIHASEFCRQHEYLTAHDVIWKSLFTQFVLLENLNPIYKRAAIYEICLISLRNNPKTFLPSGSLNGLEEHIKEYFQSTDFELHELQDALTLLIMVATSIKFNRVNLSEVEVESWLSEYKNHVDIKLDQMFDPSDRCRLLEVRGRFAMFIDREQLAVSSAYFLEIASLINTAEFYPVSEFYNHLNKYVETAIILKTEHWEGFVEQLEIVISAVEPAVSAREGNFKIAKRLINKGALYLENGETKYLLKALDLFHQSKGHFRVAEYLEGYLITLISIAQVYAATRMLFAAKYYCLCAIWVIRSSENTALLKRFSDAFAILLITDFSEGAWVQVLNDLDRYLHFRSEYNSPEFDPNKDQQLEQIFKSMTLIFALSPLLKPELATFLTDRADRLSWIYDNYLSVEDPELKSQLTDQDIQNRLLETVLADQPLNDLGKTRTINWNALGIKWIIGFENDFETNASGEEFCALLQILLVEMGDIKYDFYLMEATITIKLVISDQKSHPVQLPSNDVTIWKIYVPELKVNSGQAIAELYNRMMGNIGVILAQISFLKNVEFFELFKQFIEQSKVVEKSLIENGYQRIYKEVFSDKEFNEIDRQTITPPDPLKSLPKENFSLPALQGLSPKYDREISLRHIGDRYEISFKHYNLTLDHYKDDTSFNLLIRNLRRKGWLDWQISCALMNSVLLYKAYALASKRNYKREEQKREAIDTLLLKSLKKTESDNYKEIPISYLTEQMDIELNAFSVEVLKSYGLAFNGKFPNFAAVRSFICKKFNFNIDDRPELNPIKFIGIEPTFEDLVSKILSFDLLIHDPNSPAAYVFHFHRHLDAWDFLEQLESVCLSRNAVLEISIKTEDFSDIIIRDDSLKELRLDSIPIKKDLKEKMKSYYGTGSKTCILASCLDVNGRTALIVHPDDLINIRAADIKP